MGDPILVTTAEGDKELSRLVLDKGRTLVALVPDPAKAAAESKRLDVLSANAAKTGMWSKMLSGPVVTVGAGVLPASVPSSNVATHVSVAVAEAGERESHGAQDEVTPERKIADNDADFHGLEIRVRSLYWWRLLAFVSCQVGSCHFCPKHLSSFIVS